MKRDEPMSVGEILAKLVQSSPLGEHLEQAQIWEQWSAIAGATLAPHGRPRAIHENTLIVEAESSVWMHRFAYHKWTLIKRINQIAKRELVSDIFIALNDEEDGVFPEIPVGNAAWPVPPGPAIKGEPPS